MHDTNSPSVIVARFLKANHFTQTLEAFLKEAGLSEDVCTTGPGDWTLEQILEEKEQFDASLRFEKRDAGGNQGWLQPAPSTAVEPDISTNSNVLCVSGTSTGLLVTSADRSWNQLHLKAPYGLSKTIYNTHGSPVLSLRPFADEYILSTSMSGQLMLHHLPTGIMLDKCRHHLKYAVQVACDIGVHGLVVATAGWDQKVHIYAPDHIRLNNFHPTTNSIDDDKPALSDFFNDPIHTITLPSNPESLVFARHPDTSDLYLILTRRDSTFLYYHAIVPQHSTVTTSSSIASSPQYAIHEAGQQNLAPHSNAWVSFTPSCLAISPLDPTLLAVATSHLPHLKLLIVRLLFPGKPSDLPSDAPQTQASQARIALATQDKEDAAITLHVSTMAPQTPYSTPQVVWRPDGSGVWVNGDDGVIRGLEIKTGKVVALLKGHEIGSKVRTLWAGSIPRMANDGDDGGKGATQEVLLSGGFDKKVLIWTVNED